MFPSFTSLTSLASVCWPILHSYSSLHGMVRDVPKEHLGHTSQFQVFQSWAQHMPEQTEFSYFFGAVFQGRHEGSTPCTYGELGHEAESYRLYIELS